MIQTTLFPETFKSKALFSNDDIAYIFEQVADLLEAKGDDYYRIRAYRAGAASIRALEQPAFEILESEGLKGLEKLPHIGKRLAQSIQELAHTSELALLERLLLEVSPEDLFTTVPGVGPVLARRIYRGLGVDSLEALEQAAFDGTLATLPGFGHSRLQMVRDGIGAILGRAAYQQQRLRRWQHTSASQRTNAQETKARAIRPKPAPRPIKASATPQPTDLQPTELQSAGPYAIAPSIELLLAVDRQYRELATAGQLRRVTPKRFNPEQRRWLPVMQLRQGGWDFNVLYSNTARAHELGKTHDWVVIFYERDAANGKTVSGQCTVVTETRGKHRGDRVVRGLDAAAA